MKRFPRTLTAAVMAGALAVGGATVAQAQIPAPAELTVEGVKYQKQANGEYKPVEGFVGEPGPNLTEEQAQEIWEQQQAENEDPEAPAEGDEGNNPAEGEGDNEVDESDIPAPATKQDSEGNTWYLHNNGEIYVKDKNDWNAEVTDELRNAYYEAFPDAKPDTPDNQGSSDFDKKKLAWLALPAALIIGGIVYHLMKDGQTYTPDEGRKNEDPTAEEKAASDKLLGENKDEVIAQGGQLAEGAQGADAAATDRGIAAETGSNAAARGLAALAVVAMVAAGAFAASRKLFA
ncbi:hypothetical protein [Corynebacterium urealyticum]|uniref:Secreted protein n=1 Tax=Corynebacterium urealyticum (strain ATCC 43042 / DSM 7109) TaxID=504474 RepID=B1VET3_CORU7|nr:hypothetical protein [Corynebacterium urealyticum]QQC42205.1 hypothetical protein I6H51_00910 [Corynebacterium urealyticum]TYR15898.1 hypothetical protein FYJ89_05165 [Corynebacterium urealyticum]CAQ04272.1 hypothetical protein cu0312 [Corynebacterium urealyticum DSM 7109]SNV94422.1 putative secreted protein [Corynebacterium urealyticum]